MFHYNKIKKLIKSNYQHHSVQYNIYSMSITRDQFRSYWVSSGGRKRSTMISLNDNKDDKFAIVCKSNDVIQSSTKQLTPIRAIEVSYQDTPIRLYRCDFLSISCVCVSFNETFYCFASHHCFCAQ